MRDLQLPGRSVVHAVNGAAATSHPLSTMTAIDILKRGGTAADAAVAACAVQCVVEPMSTGIGGDNFVLYAPKGTDKVWGLNASGKAPKGISAEYLMERQINRIETESVHSVTIPGAIDGWDKLLSKYGKLGLEACLQPAINYAEKGFAITPRVASDWGRMAAKLKNDPSTAKKYLVKGQAPKAGDIHYLPELAKTLKAVAKKGRDAFYYGAIAADMVKHLKSHGGTHALDDFADAEAEIVEPIGTKYRGRTIRQIPPNGQGVTALVMMNILQGFDLSKWDPLSPERIHLEAEATRLAYSMRDMYVADPRFSDVPLKKMLSAKYADELRAKISMDRAMGPEEGSALPIYRDTIYLTVVDKDRNVCSFINSLYFGFGSTITSDKTGVLFQNRGAGFRVQPGHPNNIEGGKRPMHTIIPGMVTEKGKATVSYGVMGGAFQPVGHTHVLTNMFDYGMDPQEALDCARAFHLAGKLELERGIPASTAAALQKLGHTITTPEMPWGGGQMIAIDWKKGTLAAGSDPRKDGMAAGY